MCLAIPGRVIEVSEENGIQMGRIDYAGTINSACLAYVPEVKVGQYVIVHAGFALSIVDEEEAKRTLELFDEMTEKAAEEGLDIFGMPLDGPSRIKPGGEDK
ncbi:MAG: HypC/HybG/HupF family hydrogenase formation chaperone [Candidatus Zixiibacteriota bacterium]|nr:MAG: HypC/HybG/HupF family hydrogenase formation chaperone [candidate division Zixibacteria bacterium]